MKKNWPMVIGIVLLVLAVVAAVVILLNIDGKEDKPPVNPYAAKSACKILTPQAAKGVVGPDAKQAQMPVNKSKDSVITYCTYTGKNGTVSLNSTSALNKSMTDYNKTYFTAVKAKDDPVVKGYGDNAYWSPATKSLNILKGNTSYIITAADQKQAQQVADAVKSGL
jgi:hypothetical protein